MLFEDESARLPHKFEFEEAEELKDLNLSGVVEIPDPNFLLISGSDAFSARNAGILSASAQFDFLAVAPNLSVIKEELKELVGEYRRQDAMTRGARHALRNLYDKGERSYLPIESALRRLAEEEQYLYYLAGKRDELRELLKTCLSI